MLIKNYSSTISGFVIMWIGVGSQSKRRKLSISPVSVSNECGGSSVAERTRSRRTSFSPHAATPDQPTFVDNLEVLFLFFYLKNDQPLVLVFISLFFAAVYLEEKAFGFTFAHTTRQNFGG